MRKTPKGSTQSKITSPKQKKGKGEAGNIQVQKSYLNNFKFSVRFHCNRNGNS